MISKAPTTFVLFMCCRNNIELLLQLQTVLCRPEIDIELRFCDTLGMHNCLKELGTEALFS
jgi:hypothetical protein